MFTKHTLLFGVCGDTTLFATLTNPGHSVNLLLFYVLLLLHNTIGVRGCSFFVILIKLDPPSL